MNIANTDRPLPLAGGIGSLVSAYGGHRIRFAPDDGGGTGASPDGGAADGDGGGDGGSLSLDDGLALFRETAKGHDISERDPDAAPSDPLAGEAGEGPEQGQGAHEDGGGEPGAEKPPAIEAPASLSAELRSKWASFDPETQRHIAQWETGRQENVQAKLREAAEMRKAVEQERQQAAQFRQVLDMAVAELGGQLQQEPDWAKLAADDPIGYIQERAAWDAKVQRYQQLHAEQQRQAAQHQAEQTERVKAYVAEQSKLLLDAIPEWKADPTKAKAEQAEIRSFLEKSGFSKDEIGQLYDHRIGVLARKAALYDRAQAGLKAKPAAALSTPVQPGASQSRGEAQSATRDALTKRLERSGDLSDAVALLRANRRR